VANGTPAQLRGKSDVAGAVLLRVSGVGASDLKDKLAQTGTGRKVMVVKEDSSGVTARIFPKGTTMNGELARSVAELAMAQKWRVEELHTEEGRLDEVFRSITLPETVATKAEQKEKVQ
jgi:ABC-2 type transport system ATP-binding protein